MWIRSQDRARLMNAELIDMHQCSETGWEDFYNINANFVTLGTYKTEERAIEVLDEIQKHNDLSVRGAYQMPEK